MKQNFETALATLEEIVHSMESGQSSLEEMVASYEKGVALRDFCLKTLEEASLRVEKITQSKQGDLTLSPFDVDNNA